MNQISLQRQLTWNLYIHSSYIRLKARKDKSKVSLSPIFAIDMKPVYTRCYHQPGELRDPRRHFNNSNGDNAKETCASCFNGETGLSWICYPYVANGINAMKLNCLSSRQEKNICLIGNCCVTNFAVVAVLDQLFIYKFLDVRFIMKCRAK